MSDQVGDVGAEDLGARRTTIVSALATKFRVPAHADHQVQRRRSAIPPGNRTRQRATGERKWAHLPGQAPQQHRRRHGQVSAPLRARRLAGTGDAAAGSLRRGGPRAGRHADRHDDGMSAYLDHKHPHVRHRGGG